MIESSELTNTVKDELHRLGAKIAGFGDLHELPADVRENLPIGISVAVKYPKEVICGIVDLPTQEYADYYKQLNEKLDSIVTLGASFLQKQGYRAIAQTRAKVGNGESEDNTILPHKTVALSAGLGFIGKNNLLVTEQYGCAVMLGKVLTTAPFETISKTPIEPQCGDCNVCVDVCQPKSLHGTTWNITVKREDMMVRKLCTLCLKCMLWCPYTEKYVNEIM